MENSILTLLVVIVLLLVAVIAVVMKVRRGQSHEIDYRTWFFIGLVWFPLGLFVVLTEDNPGFWGLTIIGLVFLVLGWLHRAEWRAARTFSELSPEEKRFKLIMLGIGLILLVVGLVAYLFLRGQPI